MGIHKVEYFGEPTKEKYQIKNKKGKNVFIYVNKLGDENSEWEQYINFDKKKLIWGSEGERDCY